VDGFRDVYGRLFWDRPAVAMTTKCRTPSAGRYGHPEQHRGLSVREAALLQGFPADYSFEGPFDDKFRQIGNAVSPPFAEAIARHLDAVWGGTIVERDDAGDITAPIPKSFSSSIAGIKRRQRLDVNQPTLPLR
jgi:DNA (cytosine-5)-methyltransferase 1